MEELHRIFVGGLFDSITKDELKNRFQTFGDVSDVSIVHKKDGEGNISKTFGYVNLTTTTPKLNKCFAVYGGTKWKGHELKVQLAKDDFMTRLQKERNEPDVVKKKKKKHDSGPTKTYTDILETTSTMKNIVPGTPVEGERNWVIGKYGRPLPIVYIPKVGGKKTVKVDPSKYCHCLKRIPDVDADKVDVNKLTWTYDDTEIKIKKKNKNKENVFVENDESFNSNLSLKTDNSIVCSEEITNRNDQSEILSIKKDKKKKVRETEGNIQSIESSTSNLDIEHVNNTFSEQSISNLEENEIQPIKKKKKKKKNKNEECNMDSIESSICNNITKADNSILCSTETVNTNDEIETQSIKKVKKKKQKSETKEPTQYLSGDLIKDSVEGDKAKDGVKSKDQILDNAILDEQSDSYSEPNETPGCSEKKKKKRVKEKDILSMEITTDTVLMCNVSNNSVGKRKRKHATEFESSINPDENPGGMRLPTVPVESNNEISETITTHIKDKKPKYSNEPEEMYIPDIHCEDVETVENNDSSVNKLSMSIIEQLLAVSKKSENKECVTDHKNESEGNTLGVSIIQQLSSASKKVPLCLPGKDESADNSIDPDDTKMGHDSKSESSNEESDEAENLFDFDFEDIGGNCKKSFLAAMMSSIEVRENENEIDESNGEESGEEENTNLCDSSASEDDKGSVICNESVDVGQCEGGKRDDVMVEIREDIDFTVSCVETNADKLNMKRLDFDKQTNNSVLESTPIHKKIKKAKISNCNKQEKHALSEEKRKKSVEARNSQILQNKGLVSKALKDVDKSTISTNRIVFSDNDSEEDSVPTCGAMDGDKNSLWSDTEDDKLPDVKTSETRGTMKLFEDSDEEEVTDDDDEIKVKPQFQGKEGEKLFKMQQKFGGDTRFKLDERFAEDQNDEEEDMESKDDSEGDTDDDIQKEKEMNISILEQVLGKSVDSDKKEREYVHQRYDPENVEHEKFEVKSEPTEVKTKDDGITKIKKAPPVVKLPEVTKDTFYSVNESIKDLFGKGESVSFSFLGNDSSDTQTPEVDVQNDLSETVGENQSDEVIEEEPMEIESVGKLKIPSWKKGLEDMNKRRKEIPEDNDIDQYEKTIDNEKQTYLYFADDDERLNIGKHFIRSEGVEEITNQWKAIRRTLTEDYKKKHKDAIRRIRKMREKRYSKP